MSEEPQAGSAVIGATVVPKKIPAFDDVEGQTTSLVGALSNALLTAGAGMPIGISPELVGALAAQLFTYGIRQTEHVDPAAVYGPTWVTDGVKAQSVQLPDQPQHTRADPVVARTATAPEPPAQISAMARAVRR